MSDLEFLPAWYPRMLRRHRLAALAAVALSAAAMVVAAVAAYVY